MNKKLFDNLTTSLQEAIEIKQGKRKAARTTTYPEPNAKSIRNKLDLSRENFAALIGVSKRTVEKWEQGVARPSGAARSLLIIADKNPKVVLQALS